MTAMNFPNPTLGGSLVLITGVCTAAIIARFSPFYTHELAQTRDRQLPLDGLRGAAALMVAACHSAMFYQSMLLDKWGETGSLLLQTCGPAGVLIFFMLTGSLFWSKARAANGRILVWKLWRNRLLRIGPLYLFSLLFVLALAIWDSRSIWGTLGDYRVSLRLLPLGAVSWPDRGLDYDAYNARVVWTLRYEWAFYLALPLTAWFAVGRRTVWFSLAAYVATCVGIWYGFNKQFCLVFVLGMLCPLLLEDNELRKKLCRPIAAAAALSLCGLFLFLNGGGQSRLALAGSLFPIFLAAAAGNSFFGFLTCRAMRCLGAVSYSLYLLHGILFYCVVRELKQIGEAQPPALLYWAVLIAATAAITAVSALTFRWVECPFLASRRAVWQDRQWVRKV